MSLKSWLFSFLSHATDWKPQFWRSDADTFGRLIMMHGTEADPRRTSAKILAYVEMIIQNCYKKKPTDQRRESKVVHKWSPPPSDEFLINVDAVLFEDLRCMVTRVNSTNVLDKGLRIGELGRQMNSKVKSVKQGVYQK
jgi:hypothetical protein